MSAVTTGKAPFQMCEALSQWAAMSFPEFQRYLVSEYVSPKTGGPLRPGPASDYVSRLRRLEEATGWQVEGESPDVLRAMVDRIHDDSQLADKLGPQGDSDIPVALRRYADYLSRPRTQEVVATPQAAGKRSRTPRSFNPTQAISPFVPSEEHEDPEVTLLRREKATQEHRALLISLHRHLKDAGWTEIQEIATSVDLWATNPTDGHRVLFEAKTLDASTEVKQTRAALSQLLEYRYFDGGSDDRLCLVTNAPVNDAREQFLRAQGIGVLVLDGEDFRAVGPLAHEWFRGLVGCGDAATPNGTDGVEN
jgi:hypothetical protein